MANQKITTYPTATPDVPDNKTDFNNLSTRIHWFPNSKVYIKPSFTASHGDQFYFGSDNAWGAGTAPNDAGGGIWSTNANDGYRLTMNVGVTHQSNVEITFDTTSRFLPAPMWNGYGFYYNVNYAGNHAIWLRKHCVSFIHKDGVQKRYVSQGGSTSPPGTGDRFYAGRNYINDIRGWGPDWYFNGFLFHLNATSSGVGSDETTLKIYKAYISHKGRTDGSNYRLLLPKPRTLANINASNIAFG